MGSEEALNALENALFDNKASVRKEAALAIGKLGTFSSMVIPSLIKVISDKNKDVRWRAAEALGNIGVNTPEILSSLENLRTDECNYVCESAEIAIDKIREEY